MNKIISQLKAVSNPQIAEGSRRFFKTGKGDYGEGDKFLGIRVPILRKIAKEYAHISLTEILALLKSPFHEIRLVSLFILTLKYEKSDQNAMVPPTPIKFIKEFYRLLNELEL